MGTGGIGNWPVTESLDGVHHVVRVLLVLLQLQRYRLPG